jgi:hypothetical protein
VVRSILSGRPYTITFNIDFANRSLDVAFNAIFWHLADAQIASNHGL